MKTLCGLSVALNVVLAIFLAFFQHNRFPANQLVRLRASPSLTEVLVGSPSTSGRQESLAASSFRFRMDADPQDIANRMQNEGYPALVIGLVVTHVLSEKYGEAALAASAREGRMRDGLDSAAVQRYHKFREELVAEADRIVAGSKAFADDISQLNEATRAKVESVKYSNLSVGESEQVKKIEGARNLSDSEFEARIRQALTSEKAEEYLTYNSPLARRIQGAIASIDIGEETYLALYNRLKVSGGLGSEPPKRTVTGASAEMETFLGVLGPEKFNAAVGTLSLGLVDSIMFSRNSLSSPEEQARNAVEAIQLVEKLRNTTDRSEASAIASAGYEKLSNAVGDEPAAATSFRESLLAQYLRRRIAGNGP